MGTAAPEHEPGTATDHAPADMRAGRSGRARPVRRVLSLQRTIGNRAVGRLIQRKPAATGSSVLEDARAGRWANVAQAVVPLAIEPLLAALEHLRDARLLTQFTSVLKLMPIVGPARLDAVLLAIMTLATDARLRALTSLRQLQAARCELKVARR